MTWTVPLVIILQVALGQAWLFSVNPSTWDGLKVTWGLNPFTDYNSLPRTQREAESAHWVQVVDGAVCDGNPHFKGNRFFKNNDMATIVVYDVNGFIAGIQAGFPKNYPDNPNNFPSSHITPHPLVLDGNNYFITAYFVDPATICTTGRTQADFDSQGTGTGLWIQNGTDPVANSTRIPHLQSDADRSMWTKGNCFPSMGMHYWYNITESMSCDTIFPMFLLYNGGVLNAFGWAFGIDLKKSSRWEHPPHLSYARFLNPVPTCLDQWGTMTTLHIYLSSHYLSDQC